MPGASVANWHVGEQGGPYEDLEGFLHRADEVRTVAAGAGHQRHENLAVRYRGRAERHGWIFLRRSLETALEPFRKIRRAVGRDMDIMVEFHSLWSLPMAKKLAERLAEFDTYWHEDPFRLDNVGDLASYAAIRKPGFALRNAGDDMPSASTWKRARPVSSCSICHGAGG